MRITKKNDKLERKLSLAERKIVMDLRDVMAMMQNDPELEEVDTLSVMEDIISDVLYHFTGERHRTRGLEPNEPEDGVPK